MEIHEAAHDIADGHPFGKHFCTETLASGAIVTIGFLGVLGQQDMI
jgi:hypothetical protein